MRARQNLLLFFIILIAFLTGMDTRASTSTFHYVALGDSLTKGYEPGVTHPYGFVDRLYEQALFQGRATLVNYGVIGLTSTGLKELLESVVQKKDENTKKMKADIQKAKLITITIGGNDFKNLPFHVEGKTEEQTLQFISQGIEVYGKNVTTALNRIYELNPNVQIVIADQYQPIPRLDPSLYQNLNLASKTFAKKLDWIVEQFRKENKRITVAPIASHFTGQETGLTHILSFDVHPNQAGYEEMAKVFAQVIWGGDYHHVVQKDPLTVVMNGKLFEPAWPPILMRDRTYVTLREYAEALGAEVKWEAATKRVSVKHGSTTIEVQNGLDELTVDGVKTKLEAPVQLVNNKTYVPLRVIAEGFGLQVHYIAPSRMVFINQ